MNAIKTVKGKIGMRQAAVMFALALTAPILRIIPNYIATETQEGIWLVPLMAIIPTFVLICALNSLVNKYPDKNFDEILEKCCYENTNEMIKEIKETRNDVSIFSKVLKKIDSKLNAFKKEKNM